MKITSCNIYDSNSQKVYLSSVPSYLITKLFYIEKINLKLCSLLSWMYAFAFPDPIKSMLLCVPGG